MKKRNNSLQQQYEEILVKIKEFEELYDGSFEVVYKDVLNGDKHWDEVPNVSDYFLWESLVEDLDEVMEKLVLKKNNE